MNMPIFLYIKCSLKQSGQLRDLDYLSWPESDRVETKLRLKAISP